MSCRGNSSAQQTTLGFGRTLVEIVCISTLSRFVCWVPYYFITLFFWGLYFQGSHCIKSNPAYTVMNWIMSFVTLAIFSFGAYNYGYRRNQQLNSAAIFLGWILFGPQNLFLSAIASHYIQFRLHSYHLLDWLWSILWTIVANATTIAATYLGIKHKQKRQSRRT